MSGRMVVGRGPANAVAHEHMTLETDHGWRIAFIDPRRFGSVDLVPTAGEDSHRLLAGLGPEALDAGFTGKLLTEELAGKKTSIKAALSDQRVVAGLGNIYVCEALHRALLSPKRKASTIAAARTRLPNERAERLVDAIRAVLNDAIKAGGSSLRDHRQTDGELGYFQHHFRVYDREGEACVTPGCSGTVRRIVQGGRSTFFCPVCQK
jgi:formamidopyrimidine-DNA glycosylase